MKAKAILSNNAKIPKGTEVNVDMLFTKFESRTFGKYFLIIFEDKLVQCHERKCEVLHGGNWELIEE